MSWIEDRLERQKKETAVQPTEKPKVEPSPKWQDVWYKIRDSIKADVELFNKKGGGPQFVVRASEDTIIYVVPSPNLNSVESAVLQISEPKAMLQLNRILLGLDPQRGQFQIHQGIVWSKSDFTMKPMTPEEFSQFILEPILFPLTRLP